MTASTDSRVGSTFGKYHIVGLIGRGGMGEVYEARDTDKGRTVALKILLDRFADNDSFRQRFLRESRTVAKLQEPHIIPIHDYGEIDGCLFIEMRLVRGADLGTLLADGPLDPLRAVAINSQMADALDAAHAEGLVHRDVKPANIVVTQNDFAYLLDFGIAAGTGDTKLTQTGLTIGSFEYIAPERMSGDHVTPAVDVYSLACVLYESLTGGSPFTGHSMEQLIAAHLSKTPPRPSAVNPRVPASFDDVIARGMAKDPRYRYPTAGEFGRAAQAALRPPERGSFAMPPTMAASPHMLPPTTSPMNYYSKPPPPVPPAPMYRDDEPARGTPTWVLPTVIAVAVAVVIGMVGILIAVLSRPDSGSVASTTTRTVLAPGSPQEPTVVPTAVAAPPRQLATPSLVQGPDAKGTTCDQGYFRANASGFGSRSGRGSPQTSCFFAESVLNAYWDQFGTPTTQARTVIAPGAVPCSGTGGRCSGNDFVMVCAPESDWIACTGGNNARVFLF